MFSNFLNAIIRHKQLFNSMPKRIRKRDIRVKSSKKITNPPPIKKSKTSDSPNLNLFSGNMISNSKIEILNIPTKSKNDKKSYKVIRLENGLVACLISDPSTNQTNGALDTAESESESECETSSAEGSELESDKSDCEVSDAESDHERTCKISKVHDIEEKLAAASLCIGVGSFSDSDEIPGLAHFLEHMVFMGSEKYPQENDFDAFLKKRGGSDNAATDCETTTFYFECLEKHLSKALDKFAQFFISPLMNRDAMTREREAIESEFQMAIPSDSYRKEQLLASFAKKNTPVNKFLWGNLKTLRDNVSDDFLYEGVHEFRKRHYSAHRMTLAIQARLPLDVLESYVISCFSAVPNNELPADDFKTFTDDVFNNPSFTRMYYIKPVKNSCQLDLTWAMPSLLHLYKSKPHQYVSWLLGHEGKGSLLSYLREKLWALGIYTGNAETGLEHNTMYALFTVTLILTPQGLNHISEIIEAVFSYINLLKEVGPQERIYNEIKTMEDTSFSFREEETAADFVEDLAEAMQYYPPEDYITGSNLYYEYNPEGIIMVLDKLNPKNLNIMILSTNVPEDINYDKVEPWFSTSYTDKDIPADWIQKWCEAKPKTCFSLPSDNKFLATNFDLLENGCVSVYPEKLLDTDLVELWYKSDNKFKLPHAFLYYYFMNPMISDSIYNACMLDLFISILSFQLTEEVYPAHVADLSFFAAVNDYGLIIKINGYNEKLPLLLEMIIKYMKNLPNVTTEELFIAVKDKQSKNYYNTFLKPSKLAKSIRLSVLMNTCWQSLEKHRAISKVSYAQFTEFSKEFLKTLHIQGLIQGNISKEIALKTNNNILSLIDCQPLAVDKIPKMRVTQLPVGKQCCKVMSFNKDDTNSIVTNYYQIGPGTLRSLVTLEILMLIMEEPLFDVLRTKEQLGYNVYCMLCDTYGILGYCITVNSQAKKYTTEHVDNRIDSFLKHIAKTIKKMPDKKINQVKEDLIKVKQLVDVHLKDEVSRNWTEIVQQDFMFDRIQKEIESIQQVKISEIRKWVDNHSLAEKQARKMSIQVVGHNKNEDNPDTISSENSIQCVKQTNVIRDDEEYMLQYVNNVDGKNACGYNFIIDTEKYKNELYLFPVHKINS